MNKSAVLLSPRQNLASCVFAAIVRDTRALTLSDAERLNHFPASPLVVLSSVIEGETRMVPKTGGLKTVMSEIAIPSQSVAGPQTGPITSWSPAKVFVISIGFYPDAWQALTGRSVDAIINKTSADVPQELMTPLSQVTGEPDIETNWQNFQNALEPVWRNANRQNDFASSSKIADWSKSLMAKAATSGTGRSIRAVERRLRNWSGQNQQTLNHYAKIEDLHRRFTTTPLDSIAGLASDSGFADQSHMGRAMKRSTGFSPAQLNKLIETEEAFWSYRLLGERF